MNKTLTVNSTENNTFYDLDEAIFEGSNDLAGQANLKAAISFLNNISMKNNITEQEEIINNKQISFKKDSEEL
jgi:hypothetical protein